MRLLLLRHAHCASCGPVLTGRTPGVELDPVGERQARALAHALRTEPLAAVYTSPMARAVQTARAVAAAHGLEPVCRAALDEMDFGEWVGMRFDELEHDPRWRQFNAQRGACGAPGGESASALQARAVAELASLHGHHAAETIAVVTHAEVVRCVVAHALAIPLDTSLRLEIAPASVTRLQWHGDWITVESVSSTWESS